MYGNYPTTPNQEAHLPQVNKHLLEYIYIYIYIDKSADNEPDSCELSKSNAGEDTASIASGHSYELYSL